jgi:hypothetical protein
MNANNGTDPWGAYRHVIEDRLASCADYLSRLQRSLSGESAPDRHYFNDKAAQLLDAARDLVHAGQDVERWLGECGILFEVDSPEGRNATECTLPVDHPGEHAEVTDTTVGPRLRTAARRIAERGDQMSNRLAWLTMRGDRNLVLGRSSDPDDREALREIEGRLRDLSDDTAHLAGGVATFQGQTQPAAERAAEALRHRLNRFTERPGPDGPDLAL